MVDFMMLALFFSSIVFCVRTCSEMPAEPHRNRAGYDLGQSGSDGRVRVNNGCGKAGRQCKRDRKAVGHPNHDITDAFRSSEVFFDVMGWWRVAQLAAL